MIAHHREVVAFLESVGATNVRIGRTSRLGHPKLCFTFSGRPWSWPVASSPSDFNATRAMKSALRHALGIVDSERRVGERRRRKNRRAPADARAAAPGHLVQTYRLDRLNTPFAELDRLLRAPA